MDETIYQSQKPDKERLGLCWEWCFCSHGHSPPWQLSCTGRIQTPLATSDRCCLGGDARHSRQGQRGSQLHKYTPSVVYSHTGGFYSAHFSCLHVVILGCWEMKDVSTFYTDYFFSIVFRSLFSSLRTTWKSLDTVWMLHNCPLEGWYTPVAVNLQGRCCSCPWERHRVTAGVKKAAQLSPKSFPDTTSGSGVPGKGDRHSVFIHLSRGTIRDKGSKTGTQISPPDTNQWLWKQKYFGGDSIFKFCT